MDDKERIDTEEKLIKNLELLNERIERQNSYKFIILKGIVYGVGTVLGASVVAGAVISWLGWTLKPFDEVPFVDDIAGEIEMSPNIGQDMISQ